MSGKFGQADGYYAWFRGYEYQVRTELLAGRRHVAEAEMKEAEHTITPDGPLPGHGATPNSEPE